MKAINTKATEKATMLSILALVFSGLALAVPLSSSSSNSTASNTYKLSTYLTSTNFFPSVQFFSESDPTHGHVLYQTQPQSSQLSLAGKLPLQPSQPIYLATDHVSLAPSGRASTRVQSKESWTHGLFIFDITHMPTGCGTWPAIWLVGEGADWPQNGEIDILEGVNDQVGNLMTMHTSPGCSVAAKKQKENEFTGEITTSDCDVNAPNQSPNAGCQIADQDKASFGTAFNEAGGGIYAVEWTSEAIAIWFFSRANSNNSNNSSSSSNIPSNLATALSSPAQPPPKDLSLETDSWPIPRARFSNSACDLDKHIKNQSLVINTSLCGDWAGNVWNQSPTCKQKAKTCDEFVSQNPQAFSDAWWGIRSIGVWERQGQ